MMILRACLLGALFAGSVGLIGCKEKPEPDFETRLSLAMDAVELKVNESAEGEIPNLAEELAALDALVRAEAPVAPENAALVMRRRASIELHWLEDTTAASATLEALIARFGKTTAAESAEKMLASIKIQAGLVPGAWFPDFSAQDLRGRPLTISQFKGQVVLVDFWATWCRPCLAELPNVKAAYEKFHDKGFEIVGISLDSERETLDRFLEKEAMTWPQTTDGRGWDSRLVRQYGIMSIPATYLLNREGRIVATDLRGEDLENELSKLLGAG
jgi:peroxiredoxin